MGNYIYKLLPYIYEAQDLEEKNESSEMNNEANRTPQQADRDMCTPPVGLQKKIFVDPRSASSGIQRTPIEICCTPDTSNKRTTGLYMERYLDVDLHSAIPPLTPKKSEPCVTELAVEDELSIQKDCLTPTMKSITSCKHRLTAIEKDRFKLLGIDPRSPAADFSRTPILAPASMIRLRARSQGLQQRRGSYLTDICEYSYSEVLCESGIPEVQVLPDLAVNAIKALKLVDIECEDKFSESESSCSDDSPNTVILTNSRYGSKRSRETMKFGNANVQKYMCIPDTSPTTENFNVGRKESLEQVKVSLKLDYEAEALEAQVKDKKPIIEEVNSSKKNSNDTERIIVWRDSMSVLPELEQVGLITFDDDTSVKDSVSSSISKVPSENGRKSEIIRSNKNTKDEKVLAEERKVFLDNKTGDVISKTRTPLGNRSNNGKMSLLTGKSPQLLRNKGITPKMLQENTPPHRRSTIKTKQSGTDTMGSRLDSPYLAQIE